MSRQAPRTVLGWGWPRIEGSNVSHLVVSGTWKSVVAAGPACGATNFSGQVSATPPDGLYTCRACERIAANLQKE